MGKTVRLGERKRRAPERWSELRGVVGPSPISGETTGGERAAVLASAPWPWSGVEREGSRVPPVKERKRGKSGREERTKGDFVQ